MWNNSSEARLTSLQWKVMVTADRGRLYSSEIQASHIVSCPQSSTTIISWIMAGTR